MNTTQNSLPIWLVVSLSAGYLFSTVQLDPDTLDFVSGISWGTIAGVGIKYLSKK